MSVPTYERFNYSLRPAKAVERKMLCDAFSRLVRLEPLSEYQYIGMGSLSFVDFSLFYRRLGFGKMLSIERQKASQQRFEFNKPYANITMSWGNTAEQLPLVEWDKHRSVVWLDYDSPMSASMLGDIGHVVANARSGSVLLVTVPAAPAEANRGQGDLLKKRLQDFRSRVGLEHLPRGLAVSDMQKNRYGDTCRRVLNSVVLTSLNNRNAPLQPENRLGYNQLFNFRYADGVPMCTFGGIVISDEDQIKCGGDFTDGLDFIRKSSEACKIETPVLTWRETSHLDRVLAGVESPDEIDWLPAVDQQRYKRISRYAPTYVEVEI